MKFKMTPSRVLWDTIVCLQKQIPDNEVITQLFECQTVGNDIDYLNLSLEKDKVLISFLPTTRESKESLNAQQQFFAKGRQSSTPTKAIRRVLLHETSDEAFKEFTERLNAEFAKDKFEIKIVSGEEMAQYYLFDNYVRGYNGSELYKSCMRYDYSQDYMEFYAKNPNVSLLLALENGKVAARCLIWKNVSVKTQKVIDAIGKSDGLTFMNRIYFSSPQSKFVLWDWGLKNCDLLHAINKDNTTIFIPALNGIETIEFETRIEDWQCYYYPWVDTLSYFDIETKTLSNTPKKNKLGGFILNALEGQIKPTTINTPSLDTIRKNLANNRINDFEGESLF